MSDAWAGIDEPDALYIDKRIDAQALQVNGQEVLRERIRIAGSGEQYADVDALSRLQVNDATTYSVTFRMLSKRPAPGYELWMDTLQADFIYILEAPTGSAEGDAVFRGIRLPKVSGGIQGRIPERSNFTWAQRLVAGTWA